MATAHIEWKDGSTSTLEEYERIVFVEAKEDYIVHPLGFKYEKHYAHKDKNGAVI